MKIDQPTVPTMFDADYFERGVETGKSGYQNYSWLPELTIKMAHHLIQSLPIKSTEVVLDFGCAKGFLVKALRLLDIEAYGVDVSEYAIEQCDPSVREYCQIISGVGDSKCFNRPYDWLISKDVFEHLTEIELRGVLTNARSKVKRIFAAVPLGKSDGTGFIVPAYDHDPTHLIAQPLGWWLDLFSDCGWRVDIASHSFRGVKDNWATSWPNGNAFFVASPRS